MCLHNFYPAIKCTSKMAKLLQRDHSTPYQVFNVLNIQAILHSDYTIETDKYYKDTNAHNYLPYNSAHPKQCKDDLPYNLAKCITVFVSHKEKVELRLKELKYWLRDCN